MPKLYPAICCHVAVDESALDIAPPSTASTFCSDDSLVLAVDSAYDEDGGSRGTAGTARSCLCSERLLPVLAALMRERLSRR